MAKIGFSFFARVVWKLWKENQYCYIFKLLVIV